MDWLNMLPIEFHPSLSECIETLAKRAYEKSLRDLLVSIDRKSTTNLIVEWSF